MGISQPQNLRVPPIEKLRPFGIRVSLPPGDPFRKLLGPEWQRLHWYSSPAERDASVWLGVDTFIGPIYIATGFNTHGNQQYYLFLGRPFYGGPR